MPHNHEREKLAQVLIVEDHPTRLTTINDILLAEGFQTIPCQTATEALNQLEHVGNGVWHG